MGNMAVRRRSSTVGYWAKTIRAAVDKRQLSRNQSREQQLSSVASGAVITVAALLGGFLLLKAAQEVSNFVADTVTRITDAVTETLSNSYDSIREKIQGMLPKKPEPLQPNLRKKKMSIPKPAPTAPKKDKAKYEIVKAASKIGVDPSLLLGISEKETGGSFDPEQRAKVAKGIVNTATGLFQFTEATWQDYVKKYGKKYGITLEDRYNPRAQAVLGALYVKESQDLVQSLGMNSTKAVYAVHVLGKSGARYFFNKLKENPNASAPQVYIKENRSNVIRGNPGLFFNDGSKMKKPRTFKEVLDKGFGSIDERIANYSAYSTANLASPVPIEVGAPDYLEPAASVTLAASTTAGLATVEPVTLKDQTKIANVENKTVELTPVPSKEVASKRVLGSTKLNATKTAALDLDMAQDFYKNSNNNSLVRG